MESWADVCERLTGLIPEFTAPCRSPQAAAALEARAAAFEGLAAALWLRGQRVQSENLLQKLLR